MHMRSTFLFYNLWIVHKYTRMSKNYYYFDCTVAVESDTGLQLL